MSTNQNLIAQIVAGNAIAASQTFAELVTSRIMDRIEGHRQEVAQNLFGLQESWKGGAKGKIRKLMDKSLYDAKGNRIPEKSE
jgi:hypothetical protein